MPIEAKAIAAIAIGVSALVALLYAVLRIEQHRKDTMEAAYELGYDHGRADGHKVGYSLGRDDRDREIMGPEPDGGWDAM